MAGTIALVGGDEFRAGCEDMDRAILAAAGAPRPRTLVLPTAAARQGPSKAAANGVAYFQGLGADASALMVLVPEDAADEQLLSPIDEADVIYLTGGDPLHLLRTLRSSALLDRLLAAHRRGTVLAGSSAGAMVLGAWMRFRGWTRSLDVVPGVAVLPHHERARPREVTLDLDRDAPPDTVVLGVDAKTCCLGGEGGSWRVVGPGAVTAYRHGRWERYESGAALPLPTESDV